MAHSGGLTTASYSFSSVLIPPVITVIMETSSVKTAFFCVGAAFLVIITICSFFVTKCPADFIPAG